MHGRRLLFDDRLSKEIVLNDTDLETSLQSKYYVQLFDRDWEPSKQREYQLTWLEQPLEYFFNFDFWVNSFRVNGDELLPMPFSLNAEDLKAMGLPTMTRVDFTPLNFTTFLMRVENLEDNFDIQGTEHTHYLDLQKIEKHFMDKIFVDAETYRDKFKLKIEETTISGNQLQSEMERSKVQHMGTGDEKIELPDFPSDIGTKKLTLEAQRIRTLHFAMI
jgi:hypothetical protein